MKIPLPLMTVASLVAGMMVAAGSFPVVGETQGFGGTTTAVGQAQDTRPPQIPPFADRAKIPASGAQGASGKAAKMIGDPERGSLLFAEYCATCHGPSGTDQVPNPGSDDGTVPPLNPIDPSFVDKTPALFAANIDRMIQHGSLPDGPQPALFMPDWGDSKTLTQRKIADLEAYILSLNGVMRVKKSR